MVDSIGSHFLLFDSNSFFILTSSFFIQYYSDNRNRVYKHYSKFYKPNLKLILKKQNREIHYSKKMANDGVAESEQNAKPTSKKLSVEKIYQKKTQLEHILLRPDTYIGSVERLEQEMWIWNFDTERMEKKNIKFVPGLFKIFDEIMG